jgi:hypothetical protein
MDQHLQNYFLEHFLPLMLLLVNESQVLPSWTKDFKKELPDGRNLRPTSCEDGVNDTTDSDMQSFQIEGADKETFSFFHINLYANAEDARRLSLDFQRLQQLQ